MAKRAESAAAALASAETSASGPLQPGRNAEGGRTTFDTDEGGDDDDSTVSACVGLCPVTSRPDLPILGEKVLGGGGIVLLWVSLHHRSFGFVLIYSNFLCVVH